MTVKSGLLTQVKHQIELGRFFCGQALKVDGPHRAASGHAIAVRAALVQVNLVVKTNGLLGASGHAGVATCAQVKVNRVVVLPSEFECTQPAVHTQHLAAQHGVAAALCAACHASTLGEDRHIQGVGQQGGGLFGLVNLPQDQQASCALERDRGHGLGIGQVGSG